MRTPARIIWATAALVAAAITFTLPATASAACVTTSTGTISCASSLPSGDRIYASDAPTYRGWAKIEGTRYVSNGCPVGNPYAYTNIMCTPTYAYTSVTAWRWSATSGWSSVKLANGLAVYVAPYGNGWSWVWTSANGWLATRSDRVFIRTAYHSCTTGNVSLNCPIMG